MSSNAFPYLVSWIVLACAVLALAALKTILFVRAGKDEFPPHLFNLPKHQAARIGAAMHLEETVEKLGIILTLVTVAYSIALLGVCFYQAWTAASS